MSRSIVRTKVRFDLNNLADPIHRIHAANEILSQKLSANEDGVSVVKITRKRLHAIQYT
jgi:hypothetical protein